jgi:transposase
MEQQFSLWVGIDWATVEHRVCAVDAKGKRLFEWKVPHSGEGITEFAERLIEKTGGRVDQIAVAIETPRGAIVEALIERGIAAFSINPKQADRFRDRHRVSGAKSDSLDAYVLGDSLRTDMVLYRRIELGDEKIVELRELRRAHEALTTDGVALGLRLREQVHRYYPQVLELGSPHDERWIWELLERAPTPAEGARLSLAKVATILRENRIRAMKADEVVAKLREKALPVAPGVVAAASGHVRLLLPLVRLNRQQLADCTRQIEALLEQLAAPPPPSSSNDEAPADGPVKQHRDAEILLSVPGLGTLTCATMLTEGWTALRDRDYQALRVQSGVAPVTSQTGKQRPGHGRYPVQIFQRRACNHRLQNAVYHWSRTAMQHDEKAKAHYARLRAAGHTHGRALRGLGDRLLKMLVAMLVSDSRYDASRRSAVEAAAA